MYDCKEANKTQLGLYLSLAQLVQISNALNYMSENLEDYNEEHGTNCDNCDSILEATRKNIMGVVETRGIE